MRLWTISTIWLTLMDGSAKWDVRFTSAAAGHMREIARHLVEKEGRDFARDFTTQLRKTGKERLETFPLKGRTVPELETVTGEFREIRYRSYRLIYRANPQTLSVRILLIAHEKRSIDDILLKTILGT